MEQDTQKNIKIVGKIILGLFLFTCFWGLWFTIDAGYVGVVTRFGNVSRVASAGLNFKLPWIESVTKMGVQTLKEQVETSAASKDLQEVTTAVAVNYNVNQEQVGILFREIGENYKSIVIDPLVQESIKASTANYTAEELVTKREQVRGDVLALIKDKLAPKHIIVTDISMTNFQFSKTFNEAIEAKVTTEQNALAAKNKLSQVQFEADQRVAQAKGEAEAIRIQAQAIQQQGGAEYVKLKAIEKWNGVLPSYLTGNSPVPFVDVSRN